MGNVYSCSVWLFPTGIESQRTRFPLQRSLFMFTDCNLLLRLTFAICRQRSLQARHYTSMFRPLSEEKMKIDPKLERSNYKTLEFQESLTILKYSVPANSSHQEISKFFLVSVLSLLLGLRHNGMKKQNQKSILSISPWERLGSSVS